jgi:exonuclease SbcC
MHITKLELHDFQKHKDLTLDFTKGINVIYGQTDVGKSCIVRAIKWVAFNEPLGDDIRKEGSKKTSVKMTLDTGIQVEKIKSNTVNAYVIYRDGQKQRFDSIGKTIPEEVQKILGIRPLDIDGEKIILNIADQIALPFLLDRTPGFRAKLFNKLTGSDITDKVLQSYNKDLLQISRDTKNETEKVEELNKQLKKVTIQKSKLNTLYGNLSKNQKNIQTLYDKYQTLLEIKNKLQQNTKENNRLIRELKTIKIPNIDIPTLRQKIDQLQKLIELDTAINRNENQTIKVTKQIKNINQSLTQEINNYRNILKEAKVCPICKQEITEQVLKEIK